MATYYAGHDSFLQAIADNGAITESLTTTPASIAAPSGTWANVGYTNPATITTQMNSKKGFAQGRRRASYTGKGKRIHTLSADLRVGSADFLSTYCFAAAPPYLALRWGIDNAWAERIRKAVCGSVSLNFTEGDSQEITAQASFTGIARETEGSPIDIAYTAEQFGSVLFWHNVQDFTVGGTSLRDSILGMTVSLDNALELKGVRYDWGDHVPLSRSPYGIMVHHLTVNGTLQFHSKLAATYFSSTANSTNWGNVVINCTDAGAGGTKIFNTTVSGVYANSDVQNGVDSNGQLTFNVDYIADDVTVALA